MTPPRHKAPGRLRVTRWEQGRFRRVTDHAAIEEPLEIRVDGRPYTVTLRTPGHDEELAAGLLLGEGVIQGREDLLGLRKSPRNRAGNVLDVGLAMGAPGTATPRRTLPATSSCGLCGAASLASLRRAFRRPEAPFTVSASVLLSLPKALEAVQESFAATGGLHAAGLFDPAGRLLGAREDIGRHNAVDKVLGRALLDGRLPAGGCVLLVSGRVSLEIVRKALAAGLGFIAAVSAPSDLAVRLARRQGMTLAGFVRDGRFNLYSGAQRVAAR